MYIFLKHISSWWHIDIVVLVIFWHKKYKFFVFMFSFENGHLGKDVIMTKNTTKLNVC